MGLINLQADGHRIKELTENRPIGSIPFAGRYRVIDFVLSSMVNSGISHVGLCHGSSALGQGLGSGETP